MSLERIRRLVERFPGQISAPPEGTRRFEAVGVGLQLLESMLRARHLDLAAHELRRRGHGHYTICSSGHEANVVLGHLTRPDDPSLLHYRSAALQLERGRQVSGYDGVRAIAQSLVAARTEPASGGRHKVFGSRALGIIPSTSTIASHLPRAVGLAVALERMQRLNLPCDARPDSIVLASFGDASLNHSTALGALNAAGWVVHQRLKLPLVIVCEDNGLGISVRTPVGWVEERLRALPHLRYHSADSADLSQCFRVATEAVDACRQQRLPQVLHLRTVRLLGHAGSDVDTVYRSPAEIAAAEAACPVLQAAWQLVRAGVPPADLQALEARVRREVEQAAEDAVEAPKLVTRAEVMAVPPPRKAPATPQEEPPARALADTEPLTLAQGINLGLREALQRYPEALVFGEDVAKKGGVYGLTKGLLAEAGPARVFNTLLDEQTILGMALGAGLMGMLPIPEIQYLAYVHNAEDQLRGEAASMSFFSNGEYTNPMLVRIAGLAYQKGFGGHFHNDNSVAVLRDIPGLSLAVPARADDALDILRQGLSLAREQGRVVCVVEPIALYHTRDLAEEGDAAWLARAGEPRAEPFRARLYPATPLMEGSSRRLSMITYGNGVYLSLRVARRLAALGIEAQVLDLRWLAPLPKEDILTEARRTGRVLMVDECREAGGVGEPVAAVLLEASGSFDAPLKYARVSSANSFIPLGDAANLVLLQEDEIFQAAQELMER